MIDENALRSKKLNAVSFGAGELWFRILLLVDDNGNYFGDRLVIFANAMRSKKGVTAKMAAGFVDELISIGLLEEYTVPEEDEPYIHVTDFHGHQYFKPDRPVKVSFPVHPTGPYFNGTGKASLVEREESATDTDSNQNGSKVDTSRRPEFEVEVSSKKEVEGSDDETSFEPAEPNFYTFQKAFKQAAGIKPKDFVGSVERYKSFARKYGEQEVLDSINDWVERRGGKRVTRKDAWSPKNFLEEAEDILDARLEAKNEPGEGAVMPGPRGVREELMR